MGLMVVLTVTEGATLLMLAPLLELVGVVENPLPSAQGWIATVLAAGGFEPTLASVLLLVVVVAAARAVARRLESRLVATLREDLVRAYRLRLYRAVSSAQWRFLVTRTPAEFGIALTSEIARVGTTVSQLTELAVVLMVSAVYLALAVRLSPPMAALVVGSAALLGWVVRGSMNRAAGIGGQGAQARARLHAAVAEHIASLKTARTIGALGHHETEFESLAAAAHAAGYAVTDSETSLQQQLEFGSVVLLALIVFASVELLHVPPPLLLVLLFVFARLMPRLVNTYRLMQGLALSLPVVEGIQRLERECLAAGEAPSLAPRSVVMQRQITLDRVSFAYANRGDAPAIASLDLTIQAGTTTAIVGTSGSGKTTIADLLTGLLSPTGGRILIDDEVLDADALASWRAQLGYVPQDTFLLNGTVRENLRWGLPDVPDSSLWQALRGAAASFVEDLPRGLDTEIGERGIQLSGGERQRLAIARALVRHPRVLLLDEATSSLDAENELRIQHAIDALSHRLTIIIITHRLTTIRRADVIHVMADGRIVQSGTWDALLADRDGRFAELVRSFGGDFTPETV